MEGLENYFYKLDSIEKILATHCFWRFFEYDYIIKPFKELKQSLEKHEGYFLSEANAKEFEDSFYFKVGKDYYSIGEYQKACKCFMFSFEKKGKFQADAYFALGCMKILNDEKPDEEFSLAYNLYGGNKIAEKHMPTYMLLKGGNLSYSTQDTITFHGLKFMDHVPRFGIKEQKASLAQLDLRFSEVNSFLNKEFRYIHLEKDSEGEVEIEATTVVITPENPLNKYDYLCIGIITKVSIKGIERDELKFLLSKLHERFFGK